MKASKFVLTYFNTLPELMDAAEEPCTVGLHWRPELAWWRGDDVPLSSTGWGSKLTRYNISYKTGNFDAAKTEMYNFGKRTRMWSCPVTSLLQTKKWNVKPHWCSKNDDTPHWFLSTCLYEATKVSEKLCQANLCYWKGKFQLFHSIDGHPLSDGKEALAGSLIIGRCSTRPVSDSETDNQHNIVDVHKKLVQPVFSIIFSTAFK